MSNTTNTTFQSRLPGVGGSALAYMGGFTGCVAFQSRLPGVGGSAEGVRGAPLDDPLSIPFAGSWGLRPLTATTPSPLTVTFQSRLPGVGGSAFPAGGDWMTDLFQSRLPGVGGSA